MAAALLVGLGLVLVMALGRGVRAAPAKKLPLPKKEEEPAELDIKPYNYAMTEKPGTSDQAIADAREAGAREGAAEREAAAAAGARAAAEKEIEAAREAGAAEAAAARDAAAAAEAAAAEAGEREAAANAAAAREAAEKEAAIADSREEAGRAREATAEAQRLASEARAAAAAARAEADETKRHQAAEIAKAKAEAAKAAQMAAVASTKRANAAIAAAKEKAAKEGTAIKAAEDARQKKGNAQQAAADKKAKEIAAAAEAEAKKAIAEQAEADAKARQRAATTKAAQERARKEAAAAEAERLSREEAEKKAREARARAGAAKRAADEKEAYRLGVAARKSAEEARAKKEQADKLAAASSVRQDLEVKRQTIQSVFTKAVERRQAGIASLPVSKEEPKKISRPPVIKPSMTPAQKINDRLVIVGYNNVIIYGRNALAKSGKELTDEQKRTFAAKLKKAYFEEVFSGISDPVPPATKPTKAERLLTYPVKDVFARVKIGAAKGEMEADDLTMSRADFTKKWMPYSKPRALKVSYIVRVKLARPPAGVSGYDFVGAVGRQSETRSESVGVVARHFRRRGIDLGKPSRRKAFWRQPLPVIQKKALAAANTLPFPRRAKKPPPIAKVPIARPAPRPAEALPPWTADVSRMYDILIKLKKMPTGQHVPGGGFSPIRRTTDNPILLAALDSILGPPTRERGSRHTPQYVQRYHRDILKRLNDYYVAMTHRPVRPTPAPPTPGPVVSPIRITPEMVEKNRQSIATAFKRTLAKRYKTFPREPKQRRVNLVAAYFKARGVPLGKPGIPPHTMHSGDPRKVAAKLASIVNAYQPRPATSGVGPYHDFYGQMPEETEIDAGPSLFEGQMPEETEIDAGPSLFEGQMPEETEIEVGPSFDDDTGFITLGGWAG